MRVVFDIEANGLLDTVSIIHCLVAIDVETEEVFRWIGDEITGPDFAQWSAGVKEWIGHNIISYDLPALRKVHGIELPRHTVTDTLVLSRLLKYNRTQGHSLGAWGLYLNYPKTEFNEWDTFSQEMLDYCENDVKLNLLVYRHLNQWFEQEDWDLSRDIEHFVAFQSEDMTLNGFPFDYEQAVKLHASTQGELSKLNDTITKVFKPRAKLIREVLPKAKKDGSLSSVSLPKNRTPTDTYSVGCPFSIVEWVPFNPGSPKQVVQRLNEVGWKPTEKTKGHLNYEKDLKYTSKKKLTKEQATKLESFKTYGWKVSEVNLSTLPEGDDPQLVAARQLVKWLMLDSRHSTLEEWMSAYNPTTGKIHGRFMPIGTWTHRMSHNSPNMGNIPAAKSTYQNKELNELAVWYGKVMRGLWNVKDPNKQWLVGCDAEGIQLRILAHYINDDKFTKELVEGDVHTLNMHALYPWCKTRDQAKTFIYAFLLGAGVGKIKEILQCPTTRDAAAARDNFIAAYPGLRHLKDVVIPGDAERGWFIGLDGRKVLCDSEHLMLAGYLQNGEKVIMSHATRVWKQLLEAGSYDYQLVNWIHDEWQTIVAGSKETAEQVGKIQAASFGSVQRSLGINCPLDGNYSVGHTWQETH